MTNTPKKTIIVNSDPSSSSKKSFETGVLLNFNDEKRGGLAVELMMVMDRKEGRSFQRIPMAGSKYLPYIAGLPLPVANVLKRVSDDALIGHLVKNGFGWLQDADKPFDLLEVRHLKLLNALMSNTLQ